MTEISAGFRTPEVRRLTGLTVKQLEQLHRQGLACPSVQDPMGTGNYRIYSYSDVLRLRVVRILLGVGVHRDLIWEACDALEPDDGEPGIVYATHTLIIDFDNGEATVTESESAAAETTMDTTYLVVPLSRAFNFVDEQMTN